MITLTINSLALSAAPTLGELLVFMSYGLGVVLGTLSFLALVTFLIGKAFVKYSPAPVVKATKVKAAQPVVAAPAPQPESEVIEEIPAEVLIAISAAMNEVLEASHKTVQVRPNGLKDWSWSHSGRSQHHSSHKLR